MTTSITDIINELKGGFQLSTRFSGYGKFGSSVFEINDSRLAQLYQYCTENEYGHSLYMGDDSLFMTISNYTSDTLVGQTVTLRILKNGNYRFYIQKQWEHPLKPELPEQPIQNKPQLQSSPIEIKKSFTDEDIMGAFN